MTPVPTNAMSLPAWPPANGLTSINCPRDQAILSINATSQINAPAQIVWNTLRNTTAYPEWNTFTPSATITSQPGSANLPPEEQAFLNAGAEFIYNIVILDPSNIGPDGQPVSTSTTEKVTDFSTPKQKSTYVSKDLLKNDGSFYPNLNKVYRIAWKDNTGLAELYTERFNEVIDLGKKKGSVYRTWELQCGAFAQQVKDAYEGLLQARFADVAKALKAESERQASKRH